MNTGEGYGNGENVTGPIKHKKVGYKDDEDDGDDGDDGDEDMDDSSGYGSETSVKSDITYHDKTPREDTSIPQFSPQENKEDIYDVDVNTEVMVIYDSSRPYRYDDTGDLISITEQDMHYIIQQMKLYESYNALNKSFSLLIIAHGTRLYKIIENSI